MSAQPLPLVLASRSPRRREMVEQLGIPFRCLSLDIDESPRPDEEASTYVHRIALEKLEAGCAEMRRRDESWAAILSADTTVALDTRILGKPESKLEAAEMLSRLSGASHQVHTSFALRRRSDDRLIHQTVTTSVRFRQLTTEEIHGYAETGEGLDKAGAYGIQGVGGCLVEAIEGSYSNVVGLPLCELVVALKELELLVRFP